MYGVEPLSTQLNENYDPPRPWACATFEEHTCAGAVVGRVGAIPVCAAGADAEIASRTADQERIQRLLNDPSIQRRLAKERATEMWLERDR